MPDPVAFTTERRIAVLAASFGMLISLVLFGISLFRWSISSELGLWFLFLLCLFHFIFFYRTSTTKRQVKAIDYPYLVIGGLAIYLAFADSERTRTQYISTLDEITAPSTTAGLQSFIHSAMDRFCSVNGLYVPANFCHWSNQIAQFLSHEYSREQLEQQTAEMQNSVMKSFVSDQHRMGLFYIYNPGALMHLIDVLRNPPLGIYELLSSSKEPLVVQYTTDLLYPLIIKSMRKIYEKSPANPTESKGLPEQSSVAAIEALAIGFARVLVWPFVLAIALALRLTKVTADVLDWAR